MKINNKNWVYKGVETTKNIFGLNKYVHIYEHKITKETKTTNFKSYL